MADRDQKKQDLVDARTSNAQKSRGDVFDKLGNEALREKVAEVEATTGQKTSDQGQKALLAQAEQKLSGSEQKIEDPDLQAEEVLRAQAIEAREEIVLRLQQVSGSPDMLKSIQGASSLGQASAQVIEFLVVGMSEADLAALAAYDHDDLLRGKILSPESWLETRGLSTQAQRLGHFAPALWQLVADQLDRAGITFEDDVARDGAAPAVAVDASGDPRNLSGPLLRVASQLRAARSSTIV